MKESNEVILPHEQTEIKENGKSRNDPATNGNLVCEKDRI